MPTKTAPKKRAKKPIITRVTIAQDALQLLKMKRIMAQNGTYFRKPGELDPFTDLRRYLLRKTGEPCKTCAWGAIFCGLIKTIDHVSINQAMDQFTVEAESLNPYFSPEEMQRIEAAFEGFNGYGTEYTHYRLDRGIPRKDDGDEKALRSILKNIIAGKGDFDPTRTNRKGKLI